MNSYEKQLEDAIEIEGEDLPGLKTTAVHKGGFKELRKGFLQRGKTSKKDKIIFGSALAVILLVGAGLLWFLNMQFIPNLVAYQPPKPVIKYYSPLSGVQVADEAATKRAVTAVMIENSPDARPQSGLADADVVFEAVAEGGITRFIALYQPSRPSLVGPVRSLRSYYADWAAAFDPSVAHVGGSGDALSMIRSGNYGIDLDQFFNDSSFWRANDRSAPHNVYTNFDKLDAANKAKNHTTSSFSFTPRVDSKPVEKPNATHVTVDVSSGTFSVSYSYNASTNSYDRKQGGAPHTDREKGQISPKVAVVLKTAINIRSDALHMDITTTGTGKAYVFQNGTVVEGTWSKATPKERLILKDTSGKEIPLVRGQTWITTVGNDRNVAWQ